MTTPILSVSFSDKKITREAARVIAERMKTKWPGYEFAVSDGLVQSYVEGPEDAKPEDRSQFKKDADAILHELAPDFETRCEKTKSRFAKNR